MRHEKDHDRLFIHVGRFKVEVYMTDNGCDLGITVERVDTFPTVVETLDILIPDDLDPKNVKAI